MATSVEFLKRIVLERTGKTPDQVSRLVALAEQQQKPFTDLLVENSLVDEPELALLLEEYANEERASGSVEIAENALFARLVNQKGWAHAADLWKFFAEQEKDRHQGIIRTIDWYLVREGFLEGEKILQILQESSRMALKCRDCGRKMIVRRTGDLIEPTCPDCKGTLEEASSPGDFKAEGAKEYDPLIGKTIGGCRIETLLGKGGMGAVYKAKHLALNKPVAVKILTTAEMTESAQKRFLREARTAARLEHGNIVQVYDTGQEGESYYIIMQFVDGTTVADRIRTEGPFPVKEAVKIGLDAARGIAAAHAAKMIHRDVKPDNIMLDKSGAVKVADFGLAKDLTAGSNITMTSQAMGTPSYMSPEQAEDAASVDARSDIYSFGATLYAMLAGTPPYVGSSPWAVVSQHLTAPIPELKASTEGVPEELSELIKKLMAKRPEQRPASMDEVIDQLTMIQVALLSSKTAPPPPSGAGRKSAPGLPHEDTPATLDEIPKPPAAASGAGAPAAKPFPVLPLAIAGGVVLIIVVALIFVIPGMLGKNGGGTGDGGNSGGTKTGGGGDSKLPDQTGGNNPGTGTGGTAAPGKVELVITRPESGSFHNKSEIEIEGEARGGPKVKVRVLDEYVRIDGGRFRTKVILGEGPGSVLVRAFNEGDENNAENRRLDVIVDTEKPKLALVSPKPSEQGPLLCRTQEIDIAVSMDDKYPAKVTVNDSEAGIEGKVYKSRVSIPSDGRHMVTVKGFDKAGNTGDLMLEVIRDTVAPVISIEKLEEKVSGGPGKTRLVFKSSEPLSALSLNDKPLKLQPGNRYDLEIDLVDGQNPLLLKALDLAGNPAKVERTIEFISDARIARQRDDAAWETALEAEKAASDPFDKMTPIRGYISEFPEGAHVLDAGNRVAELRKTGLPEGVLRMFEKGLYQFQKDDVQLVLVPGGEYTLGTDGGKPEEGPSRKVSMSSFLIYKSEVTNEMFARFLNQTKADSSCPGLEKEGDAWRPAAGKEKFPVTNVTWTEADAYSKWVGGALPTEAQWETAARGPHSAPYPWGTAMVAADNLNCAAGGPGALVAVGSYPQGASPFGGLDMSGNAAEWCLDWFDEAFYGTRQPGETDPVNDQPSFSRAIRGGAFSSPPENCTVSARTGLDPDTRIEWIGFRVVLKIAK